MVDHGPPGWLRAWAGISLASNVYAGISFSVGGVLAILAHFVGASEWHWFLFGSCLPPGPLYLFFSSDRMMRKKLATFREWKAAKLIDQVAYDALCKEALDWYKARRFGKPLPPSRESASG
jgi:hypothetical protein